MSLHQCVRDVPNLNLAGFIARRLNSITRRQDLPAWSNEIARRIREQQPVAIRVMSSTTRAQRFHMTEVGGATMR
jgi:hypothetical protein